MATSTANTGSSSKPMAIAGIAWADWITCSSGARSTRSSKCRIEAARGQSPDVGLEPRHPRLKHQRKRSLKALKVPDQRLETSMAGAAQVTWTTLMWGLLIFAALLPIGLLSWYAFRLTSQSARELVGANNLAAATITAELVSRELEHSIDLARAFAALPGMVEAVRLRDTEAARAEEEVRARLRTLVQSYPRVDRAFVTDPNGLLWSDYPRAPESLGQNFSHRDWYRGLSRAWTPYVSEVFQRHAEPKPLVVAIATPIRKEQRVLGALVYQYRLDDLTAWIMQINLGRSGYIFVLDHTGTVAVHPKVDLQARAYDDYAALSPVQNALRGAFHTAEYRDPL